jgi:hypothetical protein
MKIIALTGPKQVGKTTVANAIVDNLDPFIHSQVVSFATPMRAMLRAMGIDEQNLNNPSLKETPIEGINKSARQLLQTLGTDWGRNMIHQNIWLWAMKRQLEFARMGRAEYAIIDDCRFENEARCVKSLDGIIVRLTRDGYEYGTDSHESETPVSEIDFTCDAQDARQASERILKFATA